MSRPLILITNDDGYRAPGLLALRQAVADLGDVMVVAPDRERSACGQGITIKGPLTVEQIDETTFAVDGTPADCVILALANMLETRPRVVLSGINRGANLGDDVYYSGTVGGAREAAFWGIPAGACSLVTRGKPLDFTAAAAHSRRLCEILLSTPPAPGVLLNLNVPDGPAEEIKGVKVTRQGMRGHASGVSITRDSRGRSFYWIAEPFDKWDAADGDDMAAIRAGYVSITPLGKDTTSQADLDPIARVLAAK
ncbi:MAG: 5'/3'-nucleotidase SurE [Vicinamibacteria bacterium]|nr:5'/3'-nucleotidase SurE [Vicinamibacteria bacterium]MBP9947273.1 5'/3'-nucleotidase SurE [Vicinamibacteria bacterium]